MDLHTIFSNLNCSNAEVETFQALLSEKEGATVLMLQKKLNIPRTTIYDHLKSLSEKGMVKKGRGEIGSIFFNEPKETLISLFEEQADKLRTLGSELDEYLSEAQFSSSYNPRFTVIENQNVADVVFRDVLRSREESYWFWPAKEMFKNIPKEVFKYWYEERIKRNMQIKILWPYKQTITKKEYSIIGSKDSKESLREIKILPKKIDATMGYCIYGTKVAFMSSKRENYGFIIDSKELSQTQKSQFDYLWKNSLSEKDL